MKKFFALMLTLTMVLGMIPAMGVQAAEETAAEDWIHLSVDGGMSSGTTYTKSTEMLRAEGSTQSLKVQTGANASNLTFNTGAAVNGGPVNMLEGMIGGYFYFGDQTPHATIRLCDSSWNGGATLGMEFLNAGNGWYFGYKNAADIYFYASQIEAGASREAIIRVIFGFNANTTVYIDGLQFPTQIPETGIIRPETAEEDWINMYVDSGMSTASYEINTKTVAPDSQQSMKITAAEGNVGYVSLHSEHSLTLGKISKLPDFSTGKITAWFYFGDQRPMAFLRAFDANWNGGPVGAFHLEDMGDGWYYGYVPVSELAFPVSVSNADSSRIIRIMVGIPGGTTVYVDQMHWEANAATEAIEAENDLLAVSTVVDAYTTVNQNGYTYGNSTEYVSGINSLYSKKFTAAAGSAGNPTIRYELPQSYDLTKQSLAMDLRLVPNGLSFRAVYVTLQNSQGEDVVKAVVDNIYGLQWNHIEVDLYKFLVAGKDLSDVKYLTFLFYFDRDTDKNREVYIDNVTITPYETVDSPLNGKTALYLGDSISIAKPYKGWAGLLEERYGVKRTNVSIGGTTFSTIGAQIKNQLNSVAADAQFDYVIFDGGCNDFYLHNDKMGAVSDIPVTADPSAFDDSTVIGAFEQLLCLLKQRFPTSKIGYVITYQRGDNWVNSFSSQAIAACEKWGISYLSLPSIPEFVNYFNNDSGAHTTDTVHANVAGYELIMEHLPQWMASIPEPEVVLPEDLLANATCTVGQIQTEVTNDSDSAWKMTPTLGSSHNWVYLNFNLDKDYDITDYTLVMDIMPVNMKNFRINLSAANNQWLSNVVSTTIPVGQWTTYYIDLSNYETDIPQVHSLNFGAEITPDGDAEYMVYIDNVYLVPRETVEDDLINLNVDSGDSTAGTYMRTSSLVKDEASGTSMKLYSNGQNSPRVSLNVDYSFGANYDMSNGILGAWFYFGDQKPKATIQFCGNWKASVPASVVFGEGQDGWYYGQLDTSTVTFYETAGTMADIERVRLILPVGYTAYVDYLTYTIAPCKHDYTTVVTPPTAIYDGYTTHTCINCGDSYTDSTVPAIGIGDLKISGASVTLYNNLKVNFSVKADLFVADAYTNPFMVFTFGKKTMTVSNYTVSDGKYIFSCDGISPSQMGDEIGVALYAELNGQQYVAEYTYSVAQYCYAKLAENESDKLNTLLVDLLNYGAAAQVYSSYNNGSLCNAKLTDEQKAFGTQAAPSVSSVLNTKYATVENAAAKWKGATLQLGNAITLRVRFAAESVEGLTVKFEIGGEVYYVSQFQEDAANPGTYVATFDQIKGRQLREDIFATVYQGETAISNTVRYSVESYAAAKWNDSNAKLVALVQAMMKYGDAAVAYLG